MIDHTLPVAVIGAGPVGLAAAAHLLERGLTPLILEAGADVGANVRDWAHVRMFSRWPHNIDAAAARLLADTDWQTPPDDHLPTGHDLLTTYLQPLADHPAIRPHLRLNTRVTAVGRPDVDKVKDAGRDAQPFELHTVSAAGEHRRFRAAAVIDASGTWHRLNPLGAGGLPAVGEREHADHIHYGIPDVLGRDRATYAGRRVLVVGGGHSAVNALLDLVDLAQQEPATAVWWALRSPGSKERVYGSGKKDALPARGALGTRIRTAVQNGRIRLLAPFRVQAVAAGGDGLQVTGRTDDTGTETLTVDRIIAATGTRPELAMLRELRLDLDPALESARDLGPLIDPNIHSCGTVPPHGEAELRQPEPNFYIVGMKSYGRAPTFLLATGYEQARSVTAALAGDWEAAREVQLCLPETGVCSGGSAPSPVEVVQTVTTACC